MFNALASKLKPECRPHRFVLHQSHQSKQEWRDNEVKKPVQLVEALLPTMLPASIKIEADMPLEYLPFALLELT